MTFQIKAIKPNMTHEEKVYEYARRISHYSLLASESRQKSKVFVCSMIKQNFELTGEACGCSKRESMLTQIEFSIGNYEYTHEIEKCSGCSESAEQYAIFREAKSKQGTAMRQLNKEMTK